MASHTARIGAVAGWITLVGILGYHLLLQALAGTRVSGTTDQSLIAAYYGTGTVAWLGIEQMFVTVPFMIVAAALWDVLSQQDEARLWAAVAFAAAIIEAALIVIAASLQAALVAGAAAGLDLVVVFRLWDVLYNTGVYIVEMTMTVAFGLAFLRSGLFPRWLAGLSFLVAAGLLVASTAIWVGLPDPATLPVNLGFAVWFAGVSLALGGLASRPVTVTAMGTT
ncbi:MAG TPA: hypothetical protein VMT36_09585 [Candidatus Saccharimonadia bacterium]|nr:hypothetical protein [Candidatus Saccharimonadia bacterium]